MVDFSKMPKRSEREITINIKVKLEHCNVSAEEVENRLKYLWESGRSKELSGFNVFLIQTADARSWALGEVTVTEDMG